MTSPDATAPLPPLYAGWMESLLEGAVPPEPRATCDDCAMCASEGPAADSRMEYFSPNVKCCTYEPDLANYLVGRALEDPDLAPAGAAGLGRRIDRAVGVTPLGLAPSAAYQVLYDHAPAAFGRAGALLCPHYVEEGGGRCGIWRHRNSVCATWFCKHERGAVGMAFWHRVRDLLRTVERTLSVWCVLESDLEEPVIGRLLSKTRRKPPIAPSLTADELDGNAGPEKHLALWGRWAGREREFYRLCARRVNALEWSDVARLGGAEVAAGARLARNAYAALNSFALPPRVVFGPIRVLSADAENVRTVGYSATDPLELSTELWSLLPSFDGRPTGLVLEALERDRRIRMESDLVRKLADFDILVEDPRP